MSRYYYRKTPADAKWGELFGLSPTDFTDEQLYKINFDKLVELIDKDPRVDKIVGDRILTDDIETLKELKRLPDEYSDGSPYTVSQYNKCIRERHKEVDKYTDKAPRYSYRSREDIVLWEWLDKNNRAKEISRWVDDKTSVFNPNLVDYTWLYTNFSWVGDSVVNKLLDKGYGSGALRQVATTLPEKPMKKYAERINERDNTLSVYLLANPHTPRKYKIANLRAIAGKARVPKLDIEIDKSILLEIPPVMRLRLLETLFFEMRGHVKFKDISTEEEFKALLFSTAIKYNGRVERVTRRFNYLNDK